MTAPGADAAETLAILRLMDAPGLGAATLWALLRRYGTGRDAVAAVVAGRTRLAREITGRVASPAGMAAARGRLGKLEDLEAGVLVRGGTGYPAAFERLAQPPTVLFYRGHPELLGREAVAIIGTRRCTPYGRDATRWLAGDIARAGVVVVSGLARGIDGAAHTAALEAGGATIAVVGTGIDGCYPREHAELQDRIGRDGLVLSELAPGAGALKHHFPERNRLITALSRGMIVVEAGPRSGTRRTVDVGLELGVEVFAVPGPIGRPQSEGTHQMLRDGAGLATSAADVLAELGLPLPPGRDVPAGAPEPEGAARRLLEALGGWERTLDELTAAASLEMAEALPLLLELEVRGRVVRRAGSRYAAVMEPATPVMATG